MILPGISGAFILLLLGKYQFIMQAVGDLNIPVIVIFVVGAVAGIISFSHLLSWLLKHWHDVTVEFFGQRFRTYGDVTEGIEAMIPLQWNKKVKVERYG